METIKVLMPLPQLVQQFGCHPKGIIHVGACRAEESESYQQCGVEHVIWIDCSPNTKQALFDKVSVLEHNHVFTERAISDKDDEEVDFYITNNNASSSLLKLKEHKDVYPDIYESETIRVKTCTLPTMMRVMGYDTRQYDFLNLDTQGSELKILRGAELILPNVKWIYTEINFKELYEDCALFKDINKFLEQRGFACKALADTKVGWGDAFYARK